MYMCPATRPCAGLTLATVSVLLVLPGRSMPSTQEAWALRKWPDSTLYGDDVLADELVPRRCCAEPRSSGGRWTASDAAFIPHELHQTLCRGVRQRRRHWITVTSRLRVHVLPITTMACRALSPMSSCHLAGAGVSVSGAVRRGRVSARAKRRQSHSLMSGTGCRKRGCHHAPTPTRSCLPACLGHDDAAGVIGQHDQREQRCT